MFINGSPDKKDVNRTVLAALFVRVPLEKESTILAPVITLQVPSAPECRSMPYRCISNQPCDSVCIARRRPTHLYACDRCASILHARHAECLTSGLCASAHPDT